MGSKAEMAVIGALLLDGEAVENCGELRADQFSDQMLGRIFQEFRRGYDTGRKVTVVSLGQDISPSDKAGFAALLAECSGEVVTSAGIKTDAEAVRREWMARTAAACLSRELIPATIEKTVGEIITELEGLKQGTELKPKTTRDLVRAAAGHYFTENHAEGLKTGFPGLDEILGGLCGGDLIVIGARPAVGKSAFSTQLLTNFCEAGKRAVYFNLEMTDGQVYERLLARYGEFSLQRIRRAKAPQGNEMERFGRANLKISSFDLLVFSGSCTVSEIRRRSRHLEADVIVIDYLQLIRTEERYASRAVEVGAISKALKALAMDLQVPVIVLSQLNRLSEARETKEPTMAELRESGDVEQDASVVMLLWNLDENRVWKGLKVDKNRQGVTGKVCLAFDGEHMRFEENPHGFEVVAQREDTRKKPEWR